MSAAFIVLLFFTPSLCFACLIFGASVMAKKARADHMEQIAALETEHRAQVTRLNVDHDHEIGCTQRVFEDIGFRKGRQSREIDRAEARAAIEELLASLGKP